nr:hemerythrin family protein [uncultured Acetatifactor sp.]
MYEMKPEYYIGIEMIDEEHKQIFAYADEVYELLHDEFTPDKYDNIAYVLQKLKDYTKKHFADEEEYMRSINYKRLFTQITQHRAFIEKLEEFEMEHLADDGSQDEQIMKILDFLTDWLINHIFHVDGLIGK